MLWAKQIWFPTTSHWHKSLIAGQSSCDKRNVPLSSDEVEQQDLLQMFSFATEKDLEGTRILQRDIRGRNLLIKERKSHQPRLSDWQLCSDSKSA